MTQEIEPTQHFFESQRLRLSYWTWGDPEAPPLLFVHGGRDHARSWDRLASAFCHDFRVVALDLRGHGDSEWAIGGHYGVPEQVVDLTALIERIGGPVIAVAHSFGGRITLYAAGAYPEHFRGVVSVEGAGSGTFIRHYGRPLSEPAAMRGWVERVRGFEGKEPHPYPSVETARDRMVEVNPRLEPEFALHLARYATRAVEGGYVWKFDNWLHGRTAQDLNPQTLAAFWSAIECPVLHLIGAESRFAAGQQSEENLKLFRNVRVKVVPDAGHWVHHDQLDTTIREIRAFAGEIRGASG